MAAQPIVKIHGLKQFTRALKQASTDLNKTMVKTNYKLGMEIVQSSRRRAAGVSRLARKASMSLRASRAANAITISGGRSAPYFYGAEFGAFQYAQFKTWQGNRFTGWDGGPGYFLHPTIRDEGRQVIDRHWHAVQALTREAFPD